MSIQEYLLTLGIETKLLIGGLVGTVVCKDLFNIALKNKGGYQFGKEGETLSSVLGKNQRNGTLTKVGLTLVFVLDKIDPNHCLKSIDELV